MQLRQSCAIILAAGEGSRMKSAHPKAMCQVLFKPMIHWVSDWCEKAGIQNVCVVLGKGGEEVEQILPEGYCTVRQWERKGTGHAVMMARDFIAQNKEKDIVVLYADAPFVDNSIIEASRTAHQESGAAVTVITAVVKDPTGYGRILRKNGQLTGIMEQKDATAEEQKIREINSGSYWFQGSFLLQVLDLLDNKNVQQEYYITDSVKAALQIGQKVSAFVWQDSDVVLGANDRKGLLQLNRIAGKRVLENHMENGVSFYDTQGICISPDAIIGADTIIGPNTIIKGKTVIGKNCVIEGGCLIEDSVIGDCCTITASKMEQARMGNGIRLGPYSHLRAGTVLADEVKIGNFVEVKNATIGEKTSIAHLTYIGDADVGKGVNTGCGCATANYDGAAKYRTVIEDHVFVGCHTSLIAPVTLGRGSFTAAGAVITEDVPPNALAISRVKQTNIESWAKRFRVKNGWKRPFED